MPSTATASDRPRTRAAQLRALLAGPRAAHILEAHNAVSARVVEEAGCAGIWASSLTLSCAYGVRDNSEITMTQALDVLESMTARVSIPILFDGDTGYGQFSHFQQLVRRLCARHVAGVCIEDKVFPKTNSFVRSERQELAPVDEFCGKLRAGRDAQPDDEFVIVARTEALITGRGMNEALDRAARYAEAGADAVLVHSKAETFAEIQEFMRRWSGACPIVCVPTTYYSTPPEAFEQAGVRLVIWANHMMRAAVDAMRRVAERIHRAGSAREVEELIAPVREILRLQDADGLEEMERLYGLTAARRAIVLAASRGEALGELTATRPKCLIPIGGVPLLDKLVEHLRAEHVRDICVVRGYRPDAFTQRGLRFYDNARWAETGELGSLAAAREAIDGDLLIAYGDVLVKRYILHELMATDAPIAVAVDGSRAFVRRTNEMDLVQVSGRATRDYDEREYTLRAVGSGLTEAVADGEWIGLFRTRGEGTRLLRQVLDEIVAEPGGDRLSMDALFARILARGELPVRVVYVHGGWIDIDSLADVAEGHA